MRNIKINEAGLFCAAQRAYSLDTLARALASVVGRHIMYIMGRGRGRDFAPWGMIFEGPDGGRYVI